LMVIRNYADLVHALRRRRKALGYSQMALDEIAGFQDGYTGKLEVPSHVNGRYAKSETTLFWWVQSLGLRIALVPDREKIRRLERLGDPRQLAFPFIEQ